jgi:hypothetical protein
MSETQRKEGERDWDALEAALQAPDHAPGATVPAGELQYWKGLAVLRGAALATAERRVAMYQNAHTLALDVVNAENERADRYEKALRRILELLHEGDHGADTDPECVDAFARGKYEGCESCHSALIAASALAPSVERGSGERERAPVAYPADAWHDDDGPVLWWRFPIAEPPYCGTPGDSEWPDEEGCFTHWTRLALPDDSMYRADAGLATVSTPINDVQEVPRAE